jgi:hypothetical protein
MTSVSFASVEFASWRKQFDRVVVREGSGALRWVKGYILATRFATAQNRASLKSTLFVEDPASPGDEPLREESGLGSIVLALHYAEIAAKIRQPLLAGALASGIPVPDEIQFPAAVWEFRSPPLDGIRFVGGYFPGSDGIAPFNVENGKIVFVPENPFRLDVARGTFFGIEEGIFKSLCAMARFGDQLAAQVTLFPDIPFFFSGLSVLRDGSIIGPLEFFRPIGMNVY